MKDLDIVVALVFQLLIVLPSLIKISEFFIVIRIVNGKR